MSRTGGYGLFVVGADALDEARLARGLAAAFGCPAGDIGVAAEGFDAERRDWSRSVLCDVTPQDGDVRWHLEVYAAERTAEPPAAPVVGRALAAALGRPVLHEGAARLFRPSAYWVTLPDGRTGRARLYDPGEVPGRDGHVIDTAELAILQLPHVPVDFVYEAIGDAAGGYDFGEALRAIVGVLRGCCPEGAIALRGSLRGEAADAYSDIDLCWTVPPERFADCLETVRPGLDAALPLLSARSDPDFHAAPDRRLLTYFFRELPLFWRLDLEVRAASRPARPAPAGGSWPLPVSALANAVGAVKAVRRGRPPEEIRGLLDRAFARLGSAERADGRWVRDVGRLVDAAERAAGADGADVRELAARVRELAAGAGPT